MVTRFIKSLLVRKEVSRPVFIIGCGRSGTTILGNSLAVHRGITYLNEPRDVWSRVYPETDIWSDRAVDRQGKLALAAGDTDEKRNHKLRQLFHAKTVRTGKPLLVEKLPINNFRLTFLQAIFPDARFIHLFRNGLEVARSIEKLGREGRWFGKGGYKWEQLAAFSRNEITVTDLPGLCETWYDKGLLEWRHSSECAVDFLTTLPEDRFFELSYREFTRAPIDVIEGLLSFLKIESDPSVVNFVSNTVSRKSDSLDGETLSVRESTIGGRLLPLSVDENCCGLTRPTDRGALPAERERSG